MTGLRVTQPGLLSLIQDAGRFGQHGIGLTTGGPLDGRAYRLCNRLLGNATDASVIELSFGGLELLAEIDTFICLTGSIAPLTVNGNHAPNYEVVPIRAGDTISVGFAERGVRAYLGVADGFRIDPSFGSTSTVVREGIGGLSGGKLQIDDLLPVEPTRERPIRYLPRAQWPGFSEVATLRVVPGYQEAQFERYEQRRFFSHRYTVSDRCDRMGYRLTGPPIACEVSGILSEGICLGAIQIPADGQPIVLLNDRQTIGGYPKIGSALSIDLATLAQLRPGASVYFTPISPHGAHNALHLAASFEARQTLGERS